MLCCADCSTSANPRQGVLGRAAWLRSIDAAALTPNHPRKHQQLDAAVLDAYCWPRDITDEDILARLLALNLERAATQGGAAPASVSDETDE